MLRIERREKERERDRVTSHLSNCPVSQYLAIQISIYALSFRSIIFASFSLSHSPWDYVAEQFHLYPSSWIVTDWNVDKDNRSSIRARSRDWISCRHSVRFLILFLSQFGPWSLKIEWDMLCSILMLLSKEKLPTFFSIFFFLSTHTFKIRWLL